MQFSVHVSGNHNIFLWIEGTEATQSDNWYNSPKEDFETTTFSSERLS